MANHVKDLAGKSTKFRDIKEIMNVPSMKASLISFVDEALKCKGDIDFAQQTLKNIRENVQDDLGLKPTIFNQYVAMVHNNDYIQRKDKLEEIIDMIEAVMRDKDIPLIAPEKDDE